MKVLFLADNFPPEKNAQASRVYERACYWVKWGHDVTVLTSVPNFPEGRVYPGYRNAWYQTEQMSGINITRVKTFIAPNSGTLARVLDFLSYMITAFVAGLLQPRPDVLAASTPQFFAAVAGCAVAWVRRIPFVMEVSDLWPDSIIAVGAMKQSFALRMIEKLELLMYRKATRIVTLTSAFKDNLVRRGVPAAKIDVVINGVDLSRYAPMQENRSLAAELGIADDEFVVGYIGTHGMAHALGNVLDAAAISEPKIRYLFVGGGSERQQLVIKAQQRGLTNVTFVPAQPKDRMPAFWSLCDVALVHLRNTPLFQMVIPSKIFEAMGMGLPIVLACPAGEASDIVLREEAGLCVPAEEPNALASAVQALARRPDVLRTLAMNSRAAAPRYTRERQARDMIRTLEQAAGMSMAAKGAAA
jgi:glycosyltransferase involved in cell wall biosynthesis